MAKSDRFSPFYRHLVDDPTLSLEDVSYHKLGKSSIVMGKKLDKITNSVYTSVDKVTC